MKKHQKTTGRTKDALQILDRITGNDPQLREGIAEARANLQVAQLIFDTRTAANLTQQQLADLVGTKQSVIARLENADYEGHSLTMLNRIARALHQRLEVRFAPLQRRRQHASGG